MAKQEKRTSSARQSYLIAALVAAIYFVGTPVYLRTFDWLDHKSRTERVVIRVEGRSGDIVRGISAESELHLNFFEYLGLFGSYVDIWIRPEERDELIQALDRNSLRWKDLKIRLNKG